MTIQAVLLTNIPTYLSIQLLKNRLDNKIRVHLYVYSYWNSTRHLVEFNGCFLLGVW